MNYWTQSPKNVYVAAHRGWCEKYPENTMLAFRKAVELGVDQIETDIRVTRDGELVLMHDSTVDRTTNGTGKVCDMTLAELRALDAGVRKGEEFAGQQVPLFTEFMDYVKTLDGMTIDLELKEYPTEGREEIAYEVCDRILQIVEDYGFRDRCVINSFSAKLHEYIQKKYGNRYKHHVFYPEKLNGEHDVDPYSYAYCCCLFGNPDPVPAAEDFEMLQGRGVRTWVGASIRDEERVRAAVERGAELITCNNPDEVLEILRKLGCHR